MHVSGLLSLTLTRYTSIKITNDDDNNIIPITIIIIC